MPRKTIVTYHRTYLENILETKGFDTPGKRKEILSKIWGVDIKACASILNGRRNLNGAFSHISRQPKLFLLAEFFNLDLNELQILENQHLAEKQILINEKEESFSSMRI